MHPKSPSFTITILGDELESCLLAWRLATLAPALGVTAKVCLVRRSAGLLGGLSTRGGLGYMDLTPEFIPPSLSLFLQAVGWQRVALEPVRASAVLNQWLQQAGVEVLSGVTHWEPELEAGTGALQALRVYNGQAMRTLHADWWLDTTPDAELARTLGVPYLAGLGGLFGGHPRVSGLGVSPVFSVTGLSRTQLIAKEQALRESPEGKGLLESVFPFYSAGHNATLLQRPVFSPEESDYIDVLNPLLGAAYHQWRYGALPYQQAPFWIDGFNIARFKPDQVKPEQASGEMEETLCFNGLIGYEPDWATQVALSTESVPVPEPYHTELKAVETFFKGFFEAPALKVHAPESLYVRQSVALQAHTQLSGEQVLQGGFSEENALASFSYWLDFRGLHPWLAYPTLHPLPKPTFNTGLGVCFPKQNNPAWHNLAFLSRSAGYSPLSQGACRIIQHQCGLAEGLALALLQSHLKHTHPLKLESGELRRTLAQLPTASGGVNPFSQPLAGVNVLENNPTLKNSCLLAGDTALSHALQQSTYGQALHGMVWKAPLHLNWLSLT